MLIVFFIINLYYFILYLHQGMQHKGNKMSLNISIDDNQDQGFFVDSDFRELTLEEIDEVNGAWIANAIGAVAGGLATAAGVAMAGGGPRAVAGGFAAGAIGGALNPASSAGAVIRTVSGGFGGGATATIVADSF